MSKIVLKIEGMHCDSCRARLENSLKRKKNIKTAKVDLEKKEATIEFEDLTKKQIEEYIEEIGFKSIGE